jgi:hypothetical protein
LAHGAWGFCRAESLAGAAEEDLAWVAAAAVALADSAVADLAVVEPAEAGRISRF